MKRIALLGSTGSIGTQTIDVVGQHPDKFTIVAMSAHANWELLAQQAKELKPSFVAIGREEHVENLRNSLKGLNITVEGGEEALIKAATWNTSEVVVTALVGYAGLLPTIKAIEAGKDIALANKETLVVAGHLINDLIKKHNVSLLPIDSEHSALFQCMQGEKKEDIKKVILTASGGPFRGKDRSFLSSVKKEQALKHPNWDMGAKITIDSASLMNKGLEVLEAKWLFDLTLDQIDVVVHPQSIIHSMIEYKDTSIKAQLGYPDMRIPIVYALSHPERIKMNFESYDFINGPDLTFEKPDTETFRNLAFCFEALEKGGNLPCIINAANEVVVSLFLEDKIGFLEMSDIISECMERVNFIAHPSLEDLIETDKETRIKAKELANLWKV